MDRLRIRKEKKPDCWAKASVYNRLAFVAPPGRVQAKERHHHHHPPAHTEEPRYYNTEMWHSQFHLDLGRDRQPESRDMTAMQKEQPKNFFVVCVQWIKKMGSFEKKEPKPIFLFLSESKESCYPDGIIEQQQQQQ